MTHVHVQQKPLFNKQKRERKSLGIIVKVQNQRSQPVVPFFLYNIKKSMKSIKKRSKPWVTSNKQQERRKTKTITHTHTHTRARKSPSLPFARFVFAEIAFFGKMCKVKQSKIKKKGSHRFFINIGWEVKRSGETTIKPSLVHSFFLIRRDCFSSSGQSRG